MKHDRFYINTTPNKNIISQKTIHSTISLSLSNPPPDLSSNHQLRSKSDKYEVEQLLRAAQDDVLLKLSTNSHIARSSVIDPDLDRRFQALKNPSSSSFPPRQTTKITPTKTENKATTAPVGDGDDLFARFAALKAQTPSKGNSDTGGSSSINQQLNPTTPGENEEDEVEKLIKWAIDAARLDPSPPSDDDDVESEPEVSDDEDEDSDRKTKKLSKKK